MRAISNTMLELVVDRINVALNMPLKAYVDCKPQAGNYHIDHKDNRVSLRRMSLTPGCTGSSGELACGSTTKRNLFEHMHTFLAGVEKGKEFARS